MKVPAHRKTRLGGLMGLRGLVGPRGLRGPRGLLGLFGLVACLAPGWGAVMAGEAVPAAPEVPLKFITLAGAIATPEAEISGMVWYGDVLVIVPQHSERILNDGSLYFYAIDRARIIAYLDGADTTAITPRTVALDAGELPELLSGFDGLEAIAIRGDVVYFTVEAEMEGAAAGYVVAGRIHNQLERVHLDLGAIKNIPSNVTVPDMSAEALVVAGDRLIALQEANGARVNPHPFACLFDLELNLLTTIPMPIIEYRITDATDGDEDNRFWVINYFYPPEATALQPAADTEVARYGKGKSHAACAIVERLLELRFDGERIERTDSPPINFQLREDRVCRNWEAIVRLDERGFLVMTDQYPATLLAFVPFPPSSPGEDQ